MRLEDIQAELARERLKQDIRCPWCGTAFTDPEDYMPHVSAWGEDEAKEFYCTKCDQEFWVKEQVTRTFECTREKPND